MGLTKEQREQRRSGIGSSDIGMIVGSSRFGGPMRVYLSKTDPTFEEEEEENAAAESGIRNEPVIAAGFAAKYNVRVQQNRTTLAHPIRPWQMSTIDYFEVTGRGRHFKRVANVEIKNITHKDSAAGFGEQGTDQVPDYILDQVTWQMSTYDLPYTWVVAQFFGRDIRVYKVMRDREWEARLLKAGESFWVDHVLARRRPMLDGSDATGYWLAAQHSTPPLQALAPAPPPATDWVRRYLIAAAMEKFGATLKAQSKHHLQDIIKDHEGIEGEFGKATWKYQASGHVDYKAIVDILCEKLGPEMRAKGLFIDALVEQHEREPIRKMLVTPSRKFKAELENERLLHWPDDAGAAECGSAAGGVVRVPEFVNCPDCIGRRRLT